MLVVGAGTVLTAVAVQQPENEASSLGRSGINFFPGGTPTAKANPEASPATEGLGASPLAPLPGGSDVVQFINSRSNGVPEGCTGHLRFFWEADPATAPADGSPGIIRLTGPAKAGRYTRPFRSGTLEFEIDVPLGSELASWEAIVLSAGGRPTNSVKLGWSFHPCRA
ncbi:MAG TPA: hypothetical protein VHH54_06015 [Actinomycetota bacterium]|nr:hypothetical protein [Actinomycetota bacterium]